MKGIQPYKLAKICIYGFLAYILWYIYLFGEKVIILYISIFVATVCVLFEVLQYREDFRSLCPYGVLINVFMCLYSLLTGIFVARSQDALISAVKTYASFSVVCFDICYISKKEKGIDWLLNCIILICIVSSINIFVNGFYVAGYGYVLGPKQNPNLLGLTMDLGVFSAAFKAIRKRKKQIIYLGLALLFTYIIIQCGSRKCLISALLICALWLFAFIHKTWNKSIRANIGILILIGVLIIAVYYYYTKIYINTYSYNRMEVLGSSESGSSSQIRKMYYEFALNYFMEYPFFGIGLDQFSVWNPLGGYSHSTYAEMLADWGFVGSVIYLLPVCTIGIKLLKSSFYSRETSVTRIIFALWAMEVFLGVGQIWFYEIEHLIAWTIIYLYYDMQVETKESIPERKYKYVKA